MELKEIQTLIKFVASQKVDEVEIEQKDFKITIKKNPIEVQSAPLNQVYAPAPQYTPPVAQPAAPATAPNNTDNATQNEEATSNLITIKSPMIGTFYRQAKPGSPAFVSVGDEIKPGKILCIVEAMKLFNEIESEVSGKIVKILVENNTPVEFDQPLFLVEPA